MEISNADKNVEEANNEEANPEEANINAALGKGKHQAVIANPQPSAGQSLTQIIIHNHTDDSKAPMYNVSSTASLSEFTDQVVNSKSSLKRQNRLKNKLQRVIKLQAFVKN